jgi:hypothetical protein
LSTAADWFALVGVLAFFVYVYLWSKRPDTAWLVTRWAFKVTWFCVKWSVVLILVFVVGSWVAGLGGGAVLAIIAFSWLWAMAHHAERQDARIRALERRTAASEAERYTGMY